MFIGYIGSGGDSEYVGRYYDCAHTQYAEDDEYHIHDNKRLNGQKYRKYEKKAKSVPSFLVLEIQSVGAC